MTVTEEKARTMATKTEIDIESTATTYPVSPVQEGMLFHSLYAGQPGVDIIQIICDWQEDVDASAFNDALQKLAERHSILRTGFIWETSGSPRQQIHEKVQVSLMQKDWSALPRSAQGQQFGEFMEAERRRGFELAAPPLLRVTLISLGPTDYRFVWTIHHAITDARTLAILLNDLFTFYESFQAGEEPHLQPAPDYVRYVEWHQHQDWSEAERFWRNHLAGFTTPTPLPLHDHGTSDSPSGWAEEEVILNSKVTTALRDTGKSNGLTLNTFLQGAWALVLSRYSGDVEVVFGAVKSCRPVPLPGATNIAGPLINTLPLRVRCAPEQDVITWLTGLRQQWVDLRRFENSPLAKVQSWSQVPAGHPLFQTILSVLDPPWDAVLQARGGAWQKRKFRIRNQPNYPVALDISVAGEARLKLVCDSTLFKRQEMKRVLGHVRTVLEAIASDPHQRLGDLPLLTEAERVELLETWNETTRNYDAADCVHRLFEEQARLSPDALAVSSGDVQITYQQLNAQANRVAHQLRRLGVQPEARVGIFMARSVENIVGLLGILKAGAAYVPLDPDHPRERLEFMVSDAHIQALLTERKWEAKLPATNAEVIYLDAMRTDLDTSNPEGEATLNNLAYVIYTSGSTGTPKGVEIEHRGLLNLIRWHREQYHVCPEDRASQLANLSFDASVWEVWPYLTAGASVHIPDEETRLSPDKLVHWLAEQKINLTFLPTPLAEAVMDGPWPGGMSLRVLLTGGDRLRRRPREKMSFQLVNHYGPTENSVVTTATVVEPQEESCEPPPIGRPIANTRLYVLDERMQPVPVGVPGELYIAGAGLARGYLNRPKLTAEKFVTNPFCSGPFSRLYRTGDLVRYREDGNVEFLGRIDQQVKIRGYRIELGEIETVLSGHADVHEAVIMAREDGETYLAAYVTGEKGNTPTTEQLRDYLKQKLPEHMVPVAFVFLDTLPLTPNGKVDRKALPPPDFKPSEKNFVAPRNETEEVLAGIWCELLHLKRVGVHDNFFQLGGHSLLATQLISRVRNAFGVELPLQALFDAPTVGQFRERLEKVSQDQSWSRPVARTWEGDAGGTTLSFAQERLWFLEQLEPGLAVYNVPIGIVLEGELDIAALEQSLNALASRHGSLRTSFGNAQGLPTAHRAKAIHMALPVVRFDNLSNEGQQTAMQRVMESEAAQPFNLDQAPLLRTKLLRLSNHKHVLLLMTHHIVSDGWSMAILYQELRQLYEACARGTNLSLPALPIQFSDYAEWQREWLQGQALEEQLAFWKRHLRGPLPVLDLPSDYPRPAQQSHRGGIKYFALPDRLCADLKTLCRCEDVTLFMLLLGAFQTLLHRYSGQDDIVTGTTVAGRTRIEVEGLVGLFLNTLALRTDLSGNVTFRELLQRVRRVALEAYAHQDVPFERVVEALGVERDLSRSPVFQVMFVLQKAPMPSARTGDLEWSSMPMHTGTSKVDLTLSLEEGPESLSGYMEYDRDLFEAQTIQRLCQHYETLLEAIVSDPNQPISNLPMLSKAEQHQAIYGWNKALAYPKGRCLHERFEKQVTLTPDAVAVVCDEQQLSYVELNRRSNQLAHYLHSLGVTADQLVALRTERSVEMVIGILGILKAGGAYLPLDPAYPKDRVAFMLEDSNVAVVVTQTSLAADLDGLTVTRVIIDELQSGPSTNLAPVSSADNLAYAIYTSGSTGKPKGALITHYNVTRLFEATEAWYRFDRNDVWSLFHSFAFDFSVWELWGALLYGGRVVIVPYWVSRSPEAFRELLLRERVTVLNQTPSAFRQLIQAELAEPKAYLALRYVIFGGEALELNSLRPWFDRYGDAHPLLVNMYGITETTVHVTYRPIRIVDLRLGQGSVIGIPIPDLQVYILDANSQPTPIGVPGEIYVGGAGVARGYLNRPELTAQRFIADPFSTRPGSGLYRTGDRARRLDNGDIEYLGRIDQQVKIRGFRIEPAEIEAGIARHPAIRQVAVVAHQDTAGDRRLVAYFVAEKAPADLVDQLRALLRASMPEYMVPAGFIALDVLPLTSNGKLDRKALPSLNFAALTPRQDAVAPRTPTEEMVIDVFHTVLKRTDFGVLDNFFDLGGHSIMAARLMSELRTVSGVDLPLRELFARQTAAGLAEAIDALGWLQQSRTPTHTIGLREEIVF
jgi:amino acid adenylation domain-containing protein